MGDNRFGNNMTSEVEEILSNPSNRRKATKEDIQKISKHSIAKVMIMFVVAVVFITLRFLKDGVGSNLDAGMIFILILVCVIGFAMGILLLADRLKIGSVDKAWIEKAYITKVVRFRGYSLTIAYYDFVQGKIATQTIQVDNSDFQCGIINEQDYIDIIVSDKGKRVAYACVFGQSES